MAPAALEGEIGMAVDSAVSVIVGRGDERKDRVVHARFSASELAAIEHAAVAAGLSVSAFIRSLTLEGAGVQPFLTEEDHAVIEMLSAEMRSIGVNLNQLGRRFHTTGGVSASDVSASLVEVQRLAAAIVIELRRFAAHGVHRRRGSV